MSSNATGGEIVRVGMIGAGFISNYHLAGLAAVPAARVVVIASRNGERAARQAARFGIPDATTEWRAVLDRADADAVVIATPDDTHLEIATAAAHARKAILLQKPMARNSAECRQIVGTAADTGVVLSVSFMHRYFEEVVRLREVLAAGGLGTIFSVRMRNATSGPNWNSWFYDRAAVDLGVVAQLGTHGIDLVGHLVGPIERVQGRAACLQTERTLRDGTVVHPENTDHAVAIYQFRGGAIGTHEMSFAEVAGCDRFRLEIYGSEGTAWLRHPTQGLALFAPQVVGTRGWFVPELADRPLGQRQHASFIAQVRGEEARDGTAADGLAGMVVAEAIHEAARTGIEQAVETTTPLRD